MSNKNIKSVFYRLKQKYFTLNNLVLALALLIAASWIWGALGMMQRNYALQKEVDFKHRQLQLIELQTENLALQNRYFETDEYRELALRESLGLVRPGEKMLILKSTPSHTEPTNLDGEPVTRQETSNFAQWINFLFGGYSRL